MDESIIKQVAEHEVRLKNVEDKTDQLNDKVDDIHKMATSIELIAHDMSYMKTDVSELKDGQTELKKDFKNSQEELKERIQEVESAPAKKTATKVESIMEKALWLFIGGVLVYILSQVLRQYGGLLRFLPIPLPSVLMFLCQFHTSHRLL